MTDKTAPPVVASGRRAKRRALTRKGDRLVNLAYQLEHEAGAFRDRGLYSEADAVASLARDANRIGRHFRDQAMNHD